MDPEARDHPFMTTVEVAEFLGVTDARVRQMILESKLKATRFGRRLLMINAKDLKDVMDVYEKKIARAGKK